MNKAIIFDRDGTLIKDKGHINSVSDVVLYDIDAGLMKSLNDQYLFFIVSNQSGIGKGLVTAVEVENIHQHLDAYFNGLGIHFTNIYFCPHQDIDNCSCKKPKTRFIDLIKSEYDINSSVSFVIGDHPSDMLFANNGGFNGIYLLTGHGRKHYKNLNNNQYCFIVKKNLNNALKYISING